MYRLILTVVALFALAGTADAAAKKPAQNKGTASKAKTPAQSAAAKVKRAKEDADTAAVMAMVQAEKIKVCSDAKPIIMDLVSSQYVLSKTGYDKETSLLFNSIEKGQYETTSEFEERKDLMLKINYGEPKRVVFFGNIDSDYQKYDADNQILDITLPSGTHSGQVSKQYSDRAVSLHYEEKYNGIVNGQTRIGIKFKYKSYTTTELFLVLTGIHDELFNKSSLIRVPEKTSFKLERDKAIKVNTSLKYIFIGEAASPYVDFQADESTASLDDPVDIVSTTLAYYMTPKCGYIYDGKTGEVFKTLFEYELETIKPLSDS